MSTRGQKGGRATDVYALRDEPKRRCQCVPPELSAFSHIEGLEQARFDVIRLSRRKQRESERIRLGSANPLVRIPDLREVVRVS